MKEADISIPTRQSLLSRLKDWQDDDSWTEFFETYWRLIYAVAIKFGLSDDEAQEVVQDTIIAVHKNIPEFKYDPHKGSFKSWLFNLTRWRIQDQIRRRKAEQRVFSPQPRDHRQTPVVERVPDEGSGQIHRFWDEEWTLNLYETALTRIKHKVDPKQFQIFDLYVLQEWPATKVRHTLNVSIAKVYLAKHRISALLKQELKRLETAPMQNKTRTKPVK